MGVNFLLCDTVHRLQETEMGACDDDDDDDDVDDVLVESRKWCASAKELAPTYSRDLQSVSSQHYAACTCAVT